MQCSSGVYNVSCDAPCVAQKSELPQEILQKLAYADIRSISDLQRLLEINTVGKFCSGMCLDSKCGPCDVASESTQDEG